LTHITNIEEFAAAGGGRIEQDTVVSSRSYDVARLAVGAACDAVERVVGGEDKNALILCRPPGHHALADHPMGFCLFNNIAVAARVARNELGVERLLIVDWDVHHGNGTQAIFWEDPTVGFFSMHRWPFYPGTGDSNEMGGGAGLGATHNLPIRYGTPRQKQLELFRRELSEFSQQMRPQLVLISAGFDSHKDDPVGSLGLESDDFRILTQDFGAIADQYANGRIVSLLEGGYSPPALADSIEAHLRVLLESQR
jgi:acetoin utilization deacetylase AcuC-like enzyme